MNMNPRDLALHHALGGETDDDLLTLEELASVSGLSVPVLEVLAREGLLVAREASPVARYHPADAEALQAGVEMVGAGLPLAELLEIARRADEAMRPLAEAAVDVFVRFVSDPAEGAAASDEEAAARMVAALETMLPAAGRLVSHHFQRLLVDDARRRFEG